MISVFTFHQGLFLLWLEGENTVSNNRKLMGATDPKDADENTIENFWNFN